MSLSKIKIMNTAIILLSATLMSGCVENHVKERYERNMNAELDAEELSIIETGMLAYSDDLKVKNNKQVTIERLAELGYMEPVYLKSPVKSRFVWIDSLGNVLVSDPASSTEEG